MMFSLTLRKPVTNKEIQQWPQNPYGKGAYVIKWCSNWSGLYFVSETAINIGYACNMLTDDMNEVFIIAGNTAGEVREELR